MQTNRNQEKQNLPVVIIGGGAAGFFAAITCAQHNPGRKIMLLEKSNKLLSKVRVSGGGRCNVTHHCFNPTELVKFYPRGDKFLKKAFKHFAAQDTVAWFEQRDVRLKTEADGRMFPVTDDSETIVRCLLQEARQAGVEIITSTGVDRLETLSGQAGFRLSLSNGSQLEAHKVLVSTGGAPKPAAYDWLRELGLHIIPPVPSLFTFNVPQSPLKALQGVAVNQARVKIAGQALEADGPLLVTHWGFSGPAVLKTSAWGARTLHGLAYHFTALLNYVPAYPEEALRAYFADYRRQYPKRSVAANPLFQLPQRLWRTLVAAAGIEEQTVWTELPAKSQNKLLELLLRQPIEVKGKTTFKEEFVTCGGVDLSEVDPNTLESRKVPGLHFAGEVLDIDGITGGFNFQAAWTTGYLAGKALAQ